MVVLVDDYDTCVNSLLSKPTVDYNLVYSVASEITNMLYRIGKDNTTVEKLIMTGLFDSIVTPANSGFNTITKFGVLD